MLLLHYFHFYIKRLNNLRSLVASCTIYKAFVEMRLCRSSISDKTSVSIENALCLSSREEEVSIRMIS